MLKNCQYVHLIIKSIQTAEETKCDHLVCSFPRGQRSNGRVRRKAFRRLLDFPMLYENNDVRIIDESISQPHFTAHPRKCRNARSKRNTEQNDKQSRRRLNCSNIVIERWGKLDSNTFEVYVENMWRGFVEEKKTVFTCFDSLWFSSYEKEPLKAKVLSWIKGKDIFSKKYVFVPIVHWGHWFLLIFCHFGENQLSETQSRCILLLDSLQSAHSNHIEHEIRRFASDIYKLEERPEMKEQINKIPLLIPKVPQQKRSEECGFYVLYYMKLFFERAPDNFSFSMGYPYFMKEDWFTPEELDCFVKTLDLKDKSSNNSDF